MQTRLIILSVILTLLIPTSLLAKERRTALVIGNGAYKDSPLRNPVNDATDISAVLVELDFKVIIRTDATLRQMEEALDRFWSELKGGGVGLFYYAGHGLQVQGRNYLVPVDANVVVEQDVKYRCMDAGLVLGRMEAAENELNLVFLDACRNNPFARSFRSADRGLARMDAPTGSLVAFATAPGSVAADGKGRNGIFTEALLKHVETPGVSINKLLMKVRLEVATRTNKKQVPWESSSLMGDFYFALAGSITTPETSSTISSLESERQQLEQERRELELLKAKMEEQSRIKVERERIQAEKKMYASVSPSVTEPRRVTRDGQFIKYGNGIVYDEKTELEWYVGPDKDTNWKAANSWVRSLTIDGSGWRMPTLRELETLYQKGKGSLNKTHLLETAGWRVWSSESTGSSAANFLFSNGYGLSDSQENSHLTRAFAVRNRLDKDRKESELTKSTEEPNSVERDGHFVKHENGIVYDERTGLEWYVGPNEDTNWSEAKKWVRELQIDGGGWKLPQRREARTFIQLNDENMNLTALFNTGGRYIWTGEKQDYKFTWIFDIISKNEGTGLARESHNKRAFAVRRRK
jgi:caspase domain-containing protein/uncharacterized protein DUF1566